jgi:hypothetical protein
VASSFEAFIDAERGRFDTRDNNLFAFAFREIATYRSFLSITEARYETVGTEYIACTDAFPREPNSPMTNEEDRLYREMGRLSLALRFEIESFYLFAYILLDKIASAIAFYFEGNAKTGWHKHATLVKRFDDYSQRKGLSKPKRFIEIATPLGTHIAAFRNFQIVHETGLRAIRGTGWRTGERARLTVSNLYPNPDEPQYETRPLNELIAQIDDYLSVIIELVILNRDRTPLKLESKA